MAGDREGSDLYAHWAEILAKDEDGRSRNAAAILWKMAGEDQKARKLERPESDYPEVDLAVGQFIGAEEVDPEAVEACGETILANDETYWWEEELYLQLSDDREGETASGIRARIAERADRSAMICWAVMVAVVGLAVAGLGGFVALAKSRVKLKDFKRLPAVFRRLDERSVLATLPLADLVAFLVLLLTGLAIELNPDYDLGDIIGQDIFWRLAPAVFLCLVFFRSFSTSVRALGVDRRFHMGAVWAALGITMSVETLCWLLIPQDVEDLSAYSTDAWGFGWDGLGYTLLSSCILAPVSEEIVYRGFLFNAVNKRLGLIWGLVIANLVFTLIHGYPLDSTVATFLFGVVASLLYRFTGSLAAAMLMHALFNLYCTIIGWPSMEAIYW
ncbi:CPBP family intramembrane metalloprotease [Luteolibacter sp. GHJ8]|uniref:CPBP family intramembrane metalloprotease n=1 Tax=Luteolibacter rhizosphaerae TaxID=2989719 RepID=A0ABT3G3K2_9BACT|nr:type II CAAX endopeptidase family protein [Luteolibacter rhizosphaerae]MCW1914423.1 CPBP family intramembrane metalloprotease [Luteolibacter rhizosphaerae]